MRPVLPVTVVTYGGLTHECDDPDCHVPGFVITLDQEEEDS